MAKPLAVLRRVPASLIYVAILLTTSAIVTAQDDDIKSMIIRRMSTNLHNLTHGHLGTLIGSAFVSNDGYSWTWLPLFAALLLAAELILGTRRMIVTFVAGHVLATAIVAVGLWVGVHIHWISTSVVHADDVGVSYGAAALVGALAASVAIRWQGAWVGFWAAAALTGLLVEHTFTNAGHAIALTIGFLLALRFAGRVPTWTFAPLPAALGAVGLVFAVCIFTLAPQLLVVAPLGAVLGAMFRPVAAVPLPTPRLPGRQFASVGSVPAA